MDYLGTSAQDVVELRCRSIDLTQSEQIAKGSKLDNTQQHHQHHQHQHNEQKDEQFSICFVCGNVGKFTLYSIRIRQNSARPSEPHFPFLENHEPPNGLLAVSPTQNKIQACLMCQQLLYEQWMAFERENRPHLQRLYYMKRIDGRVSSNNCEQNSNKEFKLVFIDFLIFVFCF